MCERDRDACHDDRREGSPGCGAGIEPASKDDGRDGQCDDHADGEQDPEDREVEEEGRDEVRREDGGREGNEQPSGDLPRGSLPGRGCEHDPGQQDVADGARHAGDLAEAGIRPRNVIAPIAAIASSTGPTRLSGRRIHAIDPAMR